MSKVEKIGELKTQHETFYCMCVRLYSSFFHIFFHEDKLFKLLC